MQPNCAIIPCKNSLFILEEFLAYLLTYIPGRLLRSESPLSEQHLYSLGQLVAELRISLKVRTFCKIITIQRLMYSGSDSFFD